MKLTKYNENSNTFSRPSLLHKLSNSRTCLTPRTGTSPTNPTTSHSHFHITSINSFSSHFFTSTINDIITLKLYYTLHSPYFPPSFLYTSLQAQPTKTSHSPHKAPKVQKRTPTRFLRRRPRRHRPSLVFHFFFRLYRNGFEGHGLVRRSTLLGLRLRL